MTQFEKEIFEWFFNLVGYFNHYGFFVNKEWKKIEGFEKHDEAEIKCVFMHYWFHHKFHYFTKPVGMAWFAEVKENSYNDYIEEYKPVIDAFEKWLWSQR